MAKKRNNKLKKQIAREVAIGMAGLAIGNSNARLAYKAGAKANKVRKFVGSFKKGGRVPATGLALVHKGETVVPNSGNGRGQNVYSYANQGSLQLSRLTSLYLKSFMSPFDSSVKCVGMPKQGALPSFKVTGFVRGTGFIGTAGVGYVFFSPTLVNNVACIGYTTAAYSSQFVSKFATDDVGGGPAGSANAPAGLSMTNLPYQWINLTQASDPLLPTTIIEGRIVSSSLRVYYTGTKLNLSGQYYSYADPDFVSVATGPDHNLATAPTAGYTVASLGLKDSTEICAVGNNEARLVFIPPDETFQNYPLQGASNMRKTFPYSSNATNGIPACGAPLGVIMITGVAGQPFYFEAITHAEYVGPGVMQSLLTESSTDAVGFDAVQNLLIRAQRRCAADARVSLSTCIKRELASEKIKMS